ncbi:hypothetical protein NP493_1141g00039 [Ridgeia piscesae]|uniref:Uncharacterized protein n=1 Tax=Ridgeia piscesae TaxID=27915 RepID=A0AAD9NJG5_RIDPI|nr:hypothetical protein NP493_1141g00039 [Ridgeia piscesae]
MLDDSNCPATDQKRRRGRRCISLKNHNNFFCFVYIELQIAFTAPYDKLEQPKLCLQSK